MKHILAFCFLALLFATDVAAQSDFMPSFLTNRRMGFLTDPTAVGWNPAQLSVRDENSFIGAIKHDSALSQIDGFGLFAKFSGLGLGYVTQKDIIRERTSTLKDTLKLPSQYYLGAGFPISDGTRPVHLGVGLMYSDAGSAFMDKLRLNVSAMYSPGSALWLSGGVGNINRFTKDAYVANAAFAFTPVSWAGLFAHVDYALKDSVFFNGAEATNINIEGGATWSPFDGFVLSGLYNPNRESIRIGVEFSLDNYFFGEVYGIPKVGGGTGAFLFGSVGGSDEYIDLPTFANASGTSTRRSYSRDAVCRGLAYKWLSGTGDTPAEELMNKMQFAGKDYTDLYATLQALSPNPSQLYKTIGEKYYGIKPISETTGGVNYSLVRALDGSTIVVDTMSSVQGETTVVFRVRDKNNRNVANLTKNNFGLSDTTKQITKFSQVASQKTVAADFMILMDCSGSMGDEIAAVRTNVANFTRTLANRNIDYRIGSILYGDEIYGTLQPTANLNEFSTFFAKASATGPDEITSKAIEEAASVSYRAGAEHIAILITDDCSLQDNADLNENDLVKKLWNSSTRLYGVINPGNHNAGFTTRLSLGKEYDIKNSFNTILDDISGEITTTYSVSYQDKPKVEIPKTIVRGTLKSESGWNLAGSVETIIDNTRNVIKSNSLNGEYEFVAPKGKKVAMTASADDHKAEQATLTIPATNRNDTIVQNFVLKQPKTVIKGIVTDENKVAKKGKVKIEDATNLTLIKEVETNESGAYSAEVPEGYLYRLTPVVPEYIPQPAEVDMRTAKKGTIITQDLKVISIVDAVERGLAFKLKNVFFDTGKWDLRPESEAELNQLYTFLQDYKTTRIEVSAHTDNVGNDQKNQTLSEQRAESVIKFLENKGVPKTRMEAKGYGKTKPVASNDTPEGRQQNRRVEFKLIK